MNPRVPLPALLLAALTLATLALPQFSSAQPAGQAVAVDQSAAASGAVGARELAANAPVFMGDEITTDDTGLAQLLFRDDTRMVVGPNSKLTVDRFVFSGETAASEVALGAARGAFRFITGNSPKSAYLIDTPAATIGVRGSRADILVPGDGTVGVVSYDEGDGDNKGLYVCDKPELRSDGDQRRRCVELVRGCSLVVFTAGEDPEWVVNAYDRTTIMDEVPFAFRQSGLMPDFQVDSDSCEVRNPNPPKGGQGEVISRPQPQDER